MIEHLYIDYLVIVKIFPQLFCQLTAYKAETRGAMLRGLEVYMSELTVLPPSAWDPAIRLDPPKSTMSIQTR